ncbi:hypothetical protein BN946_scf185033.g12 [Trametes cinnabarina]|uniref:Uncharacterized protein n=1 Tax=Pycnoporus cinnabarinus TaxID=5643 RepID=A0A060SR48_PYCCI|nr:hypothetical protein BN946_scf185033.g12 [Trametes cinnabarina]
MPLRSRGLNAMETRWEAKFQQVEGEIEEVASRNARVLRTAQELKREQASSVARTSQLEADLGDVCNRVAELSQSVGVMLTDIKDHLHHEKDLLKDKWGSLRRGLNELSQKVAHVDFELDIMKSQRSVDRARTEQVQNGLAVLEACSSVTTNTVQRLECDIARLEHLSEQQALAVEQLALVQADYQCGTQDMHPDATSCTLAEELRLGSHSTHLLEDTSDSCVSDGNHTLLVDWEPIQAIVQANGSDGEDIITDSVDSASTSSCASIDSSTLNSVAPYHTPPARRFLPQEAM